MFNSVLIANRGEIACRVIRTLRRLGIRSIAVYSDADRNALHVQMADDAIHLGGSAASDSYLDVDKVIAAAKQSGAEAIHPGYGFLSENAGFCQRCDEAGIVFIGPPVGAIESMGSKSMSKRIMTDAGVPLLPGYHGDDQDEALLRKTAAEIGYPVLLKASAGGGGKGMRIVWSEAEFSDALAGAKREATKAFGDDKMLVEKYLTGPRHVEVQVFCDSHGNGVHLFERDCSLQRRHQKVIEEAPAPKMSESLRHTMGDAAVQAAKAINYRGAGTVEFLLADSGEFYFMEMNTRLQVEHPVTELITGQDLVEWQLQVASGAPLPKRQDELAIHGHAFEARIYAEDTDNQFLPQTGRVDDFRLPELGEHVRIDSGVRAGDEISVFYDPMIAKLVVWGHDRSSALRRLRTALADFHIGGVTTNRRFLQQLAGSADFAEEDFDTGFIDKHLDTLHSDARQQRAANRQRDIALAAMVLLAEQRSHSLDSYADSPWAKPFGWRLNAPAQQVLRMHFGDESIQVVAEFGRDEHLRCIHIDDDTVRINGRCFNGTIEAEVDDRRYQLSYCRESGQEQDGFCLYTETADVKFSAVDVDFLHAEDSAGELTAPMNGTIVSVLVEPGTDVKKGTALLVMEAMKMEHSIAAPADGRVAEFFFSAGQLVEGGAELLRFEEES